MFRWFIVLAMLAMFRARGGVIACMRLQYRLNALTVSLEEFCNFQFLGVLIISTCNIKISLNRLKIVIIRCLNFWILQIFKH
jgi:hypothetical protein